jgi:hypothetical protein
LVLFAALPAAAQTLTPAEQAARDAVVQKEEAKSRFISGWIETGFTGNFDSPKDNQNFGRLLDDRSNELVMNQAAVNIERTLAQEQRFDCCLAQTRVTSTRSECVITRRARGSIRAISPRYTLVCIFRW